MPYDALWQFDCNMVDHNRCISTVHVWKLWLVSFHLMTINFWFIFFRLYTLLLYCMQLIRTDEVLSLHTGVGGRSLVTGAIIRIVQPIQYNTIQYNTIQYNTIQYNLTKKVSYKKVQNLNLSKLGYQTMHREINKIICPVTRKYVTNTYNNREESEARKYSIWCKLVTSAALVTLFNISSLSMVIHA